MQTRYGFTLFNIDEFATWLAGVRLSRHVSIVQQHHTWSPSYADFDGANHFERQRAMKAHHVNANGWADIGQHFTIFPDGLVMTGRPLGKTPACIYGANAGAVCIENLGNFDSGHDVMRPEQAEAIIAVTALLAARFKFETLSTRNIVYHHWFDLATGARTTDVRRTKSCPGTGFFGGNGEAACRMTFLPLVQGKLDAIRH